MDLVQAHLYYLEESYDKEYGKCVARPFDQKVRISSCKWAG